MASPKARISSNKYAQLKSYAPAPQSNQKKNRPFKNYKALNKCISKLPRRSSKQVKPEKLSQASKETETPCDSHCLGWDTAHR